jgi:hypothetical protein
VNASADLSNEEYNMFYIVEGMEIIKKQTVMNDFSGSESSGPDFTA